jgi:hypothetical protein
VVPRRVPSHAYLKALYRYPQRAFPYRGTARGERAPRPRRPRVRADRHRDLRRRRVLRHHGRIRQARRRRRPHADHGDQPRPRAAPLHVLPSCGFATSGRGAPASRGRASPRAGRPSTATLVADHATLGARWIFTDGGRATVLFTENETDYERAFGVGHHRRTSRARSTASCAAKTPTPSTRGRFGSKAALHYRWMIEPGATRTVRLRMTDDPLASGIDDDFDATFDEREARPITSTRDRGGGTRSGGAHDPAPRLRRADLVQAVLQLRGARLARGRSAMPAPPPSASTAATRAGATSTTTTCSRCPTPGSIPGTRPGTSPST